jgi:Flp pilus assembly protein TadD
MSKNLNSDAESLSQQGFKSIEAGNHEEAVASYDHALELNPNYAEV